MSYEKASYDTLHACQPGCNLPELERGQETRNPKRYNATVNKLKKVQLQQVHHARNPQLLFQSTDWDHSGDGASSATALPVSALSNMTTPYADHSREGAANWTATCKRMIRLIQA